MLKTGAAFVFSLTLGLAAPAMGCDEARIAVLAHAGSPADLSARILSEEVRNRGYESGVVDLGPRAISSLFDDYYAMTSGYDQQLLEVYYQSPSQSPDVLRPVITEDDAVNAGFDPDYLVVEKDNRTVMLMGLGWIPFWLVLPRDQTCGPPSSWRKPDGSEASYCIEQTDDAAYTVKVKVGHRGFSMGMLAAGGNCRDAMSRDMRHMMEQVPADLAAERHVESLSQKWLLTAVDNGREVTFELYAPDGGAPIRTASSDTAGPVIEPIQTSGGGRRNTCGGPSGACPMFYDPQDYRAMQDFESMLSRFSSVLPSR